MFFSNSDLILSIWGSVLDPFLIFFLLFLAYVLDQRRQWAQEAPGGLQEASPEPHGNHFGLIWGPFLAHFGCLLGHILGSFLRPRFQKRFWLDSGSFWSHFRASLRSKNEQKRKEGVQFWCFSDFEFRLNFEVVPVPFWSHFWYQKGAILE